MDRLTLGDTVVCRSTRVGSGRPRALKRDCRTFLPVGWWVGRRAGKGGWGSRRAKGPGGGGAGRLGGMYGQVGRASEAVERASLAASSGEGRRIWLVGMVRVGGIGGGGLGMGSDDSSELVRVS